MEKISVFLFNKRVKQIVKAMLYQDDLVICIGQRFNIHGTKEGGRDRGETFSAAISATMRLRWSIGRSCQGEGMQLSAYRLRLILRHQILYPDSTYRKHAVKVRPAAYAQLLCSAIGGCRARHSVVRHALEIASNQLATESWYDCIRPGSTARFAIKRHQ